MPSEYSLPIRRQSSWRAATYYLFIDLGPDGMERWFTKDNPAAGLDKKRGVTVSKMLVDEGATIVLSDELGEGPFHMLRDSYIGVYPVEGGVSVKDAVDLFLSNKLMPRTEGGKDDKNHRVTDEKRQVNQRQPPPSSPRESSY